MRKWIIFGGILILAIVIFLVVRNSDVVNYDNPNTSNDSVNPLVNDDFDNLDEKIRCKQDSDCAWAENLSACCPTYLVTNLETINKYIELEQNIYYSNNHSTFKVPKTNYNGSRICGNITGCLTMASEPPLDIKCELNKCNPHYKLPNFPTEN